MSVSFLPFTPSNPKDNLICGICLDPDAKDRFYAHEGENGRGHPFHPECIKRWIKDHQTCPACRENINPSSLYSQREKIGYSLKEKTLGIGKVIAVGAAVAETLLATTVIKTAVQASVGSVLGPTSGTIAGLAAGAITLIGSGIGTAIVVSEESISPAGLESGVLIATIAAIADTTVNIGEKARNATIQAIERLVNGLFDLE